MELRVEIVPGLDHKALRLKLYHPGDSLSLCSRHMSKNGDCFVGRKKTRRFTSGRSPSRARKKRLREKWSEGSIVGTITEGNLYSYFSKNV